MRLLLMWILFALWAAVAPAQTDTITAEEVGAAITMISTLNFMVGLYDDYATECYADSEEVDIGYRIYGDENGELIARRESRWIHAEPTFQGFMEYLRKRLEEQ